jgi:hypothetical protein
VSTSIDEARHPVLDVASTGEEWGRALPASVREKLLTDHDRKQLLKLADTYLRVQSPECLAEVERDVYRLASQLEPALGKESTLRFLRDGLAGSLDPAIWRVPETAWPLEKLLLRVTDSIWQAYSDALQETIRRQQEERFQQELTLAKRIQERLLPKHIPQIPGFDIAGRVMPAAEVGGDYWSCKVYPEDDIVTLKLADVTGHGIAAATLVAAVKFISGGYYRGSKTAAQVMERTNTVLVRETPHEIMVTMFYGWLHPESGEMSVVNAGHSPVLHYQRGRFCHIPPTGIALGMMETKYREVRVSLDPGDIFITTSDGLTEPSAEHALGVKWVEEQVAAFSDLPAAELADLLIDGALAAYGTPKDDISVLIVKRLKS